MDIFSPINELGKEGWQSLRTLVLSCQRTVLWAPSALYLNSLRNIDPLLPSPEEILWYIRQGHIQYRAREWWIRNTNRRKKHAWPLATWQEDFDGAISDIWKADQRANNTGVSARVVIIGPERGWEWADEQIDGGLVDHKKIYSIIQTNRVLTGYKEKIQQGLSSLDATRLLLRDIKNQADSFLLSGANRNFGMHQDRYLLRLFNNTVKSTGIKVIPTQKGKSELELLVPIISEVINKLDKAGKPVKNQEEAFDRIQRLLEEESTQFREWVTSADKIVQNYEREDITDELINQVVETIKKGVPKHTYIDYIFPQSPIDKITTVLSLIIGAASIISGGPLAPVGIVPLALKPFSGTLKWLGLINDDYEGPYWPFYLAEGKRNVGRRRREKLLSNIQRTSS